MVGWIKDFPVLWFNWFTFINPFIIEGKSLDHVDKLPDIIHLAECLTEAKWCIVHIHPLELFKWTNDFEVESANLMQVKTPFQK